MIYVVMFIVFVVNEGSTDIYGLFIAVATAIVAIGRHALILIAIGMVTPPLKIL